MHTVSLHLWENITYIGVSHMRSWIFGGDWESYHCMLLLSLIQMLYFVGLLIVSFLTCVHSQSMFHHCPKFCITAQELVSNELRVLGTCIVNGKLYQSLIFLEQCLWVDGTRLFQRVTSKPCTRNVRSMFCALACMNKTI